MCVKDAPLAKVYIAGPMTGIADWNFLAFFEAEEKLLSLGFEVVNPAHNDGKTVEEALENAGSPERPNYTWAYYMRRDLPHVMDVDMICLLPGWQSSRGAQLEVHVAKALGLPLMILKDGQLVPRVEVIGLSGYARSGKDTAADYLVEHKDYVKRSFATPIKQAMEILNPTVEVAGHYVQLASLLHTSGWESAKDLSEDARRLLQVFGTEVGREMFGQNFWVDYGVNNLEDGARVVFADVRFPNEADAIKELGGHVIRVERLGIEAVNGHISEHALDGYQFDATLLNYGTLDEFFASVDGQLELFADDSRV
jgi:hypothetical protein